VPQAPGRPSNPVIVAVFALLCLIWGTTWAAIQIGLAGIPPFTGVALRFAIAAALLLALARALGLRLGRHPLERRVWLVNGLFSFVVSYGVVYWCEQWVPAGLTSVLFATYPLFVALVGRFLLPAEGLSRRELVSMLVAFAGVGVIFASDFAALGGPQVALASALVLVSPLAAAIGSVLVKRWGAGIHPISITAVPMALTAAVMGSVALAVERGKTLVWDGASISSLLYLAVFGSAVSFSLYYWLLSHLAVKRLALITYVTPIVAVLVGVLRGEPLTAHVLAGGGLVIVGVALTVHRR